MVKSTVVIPNYNGIRYIEDCLDSLYAGTQTQFEAIMVDNASTDGSRELVQEKFPQVKLICNETNTGFSEAVNQGIQASTTPYVILLNNDTRADKAFIHELEKAIEKDARIFSASAKLISLHDMTKLDDAGDYYCALSVVCCVVFEYLIQRFLLRGACTVGNLSAVVTGVLLAFNLPASIPWWIVMIGAFVAIAIGKMTFGGLGRNPFNPALVGRVFLLIAYPAYMTSFPQPAGAVADAFSGATPLAAVKFGVVSASAIDYQDMLFGSIPGSLGEVAALALLAGFVYLLWRRVITWHIPVTILVTMAVFAFFVALGRGWTGGLLYEFPAFHVLAGGAILGAVFMATDYSTSPMTVRGGVIYAVGIGVITMCIRLWGAYPEGMSFAILIMNATVPLINRSVKPKRFGAKKQ